MNIKSIEEKFWILCKIADEEYSKNTDMTPDLELALLNILSYVKENSGEKEIFKKLFIQSWINEKRKVTHWIVLFCMRELRWSEVQEEINAYFELQGGAKGIPGLMDFISDLNWVYNDALWEDADFFKYHWKREHPEEPWPLETKKPS